MTADPTAALTEALAVTREQRFWAKVEKTDTCWNWIGATTRGGYGSFWNGTTAARAHRWSYEHLVGPIPDGLQLDHLCRNRACVNPEHLEPVTNQVNQLRGVRPAQLKAQFAAITHCPQGHEYTDENTRIGRNGMGCPSRKCRACHAASERRRQAARRIARAEGGDGHG